MNKLRQAWHCLLENRVLVLVLSMIFLHAVIVYYAVIRHHSNERLMYQQQMVQKIINTIYLVEAMPPAGRAHAVSAITDPALSVSVTPEATWSQQFKELSFWQISKVLRESGHALQTSIRIGDQQWLNIKTKPHVGLDLDFLISLAAEFFIFSILLVSAWAVNRYAQPMMAIKQATERLSQNLHAKPLHLSGPALVRETVFAMNVMQDRIQKLIADRTRMLAAISHDLRTPITRMKLRTHFIEDATIQSDYIHDLDEMTMMISETLNFAKADAHDEGCQSLDMVSLLRTLCEQAEDAGHCVLFHAEQGRIPFSGRQIALRRALGNLIYNAIRYADQVEVSIIQTEQAIEIRVCDDGPGIPEDKLEEVFQPFYRVEAARPRDTQGFGLGLAVTRDVIQAHGGSIALTNRELGGLCACVCLGAVDKNQ